MIALCLLLLANDWLVVPGERVGPIRASTTKSELVAMFGAEAVQDKEIDIGEGDYHPGALIYPNDQTRSLAIVWELGYVRVCYNLNPFGKERCRWKTPQGISIGTTLKDLETLNGRPFNVAYYGWDGGGFVASWQGGRLSDVSEKGGMCLMLIPPREVGWPMLEKNQVRRDGTFSSSDSTIRKLNARVGFMSVSVRKQTPARP